MMNQEAYWQYLKPLVPKILGQLDRDPESPTYGSFDRNFWNYKIRDFSSAIIQQGMLVLDVIYRYKSKGNPYYRNKRIKSLIEAAVNYWTNIQLKNGSFNEYYPFEAGFPPTGFSLYAVSLLMDDEHYSFNSKLNQAVEKAIGWILRNPEKEALNQECAALSGISIAVKKAVFKYDRETFEKRLDDFYKAQSPEGWFNEYNGPDIGYLSVTIDCLADVFEITGDERADEAIQRAIVFINSFVTDHGYSPVMINSRNTDYIVPYAISKVAEQNAVATELLIKLFKNIEADDNQLYKTDDRYLCHYIGQSFFRTIFNLQADLKEPVLENTSDTHFFKDAGIFTYRNKTESLFVSLRKGGIINVIDSNGVIKTDFGYRIPCGAGKVAVTHWQDPSYEINYSEEADEIYLHVKGRMSIQKYLRPSPLKHIVLRVMSSMLGNKIIPLLKKQLIFREKKSDFTFERLITIQKDGMHIKDDLHGVKNETIHKARHYSMRHVSSAGRFCFEELLDEDKDFTRADFPLTSKILWRN